MSEIQSDLDAIHVSSLPYRVGRPAESRGDRVAIVDARGHTVLWSEEIAGDPSETADDRARRVVTAVNSLPALLAACEAMREIQLGTFDDLSDDEWEQHRNIILRNATVAIASARTDPAAFRTQLADMEPGATAQIAGHRVARLGGGRFAVDGVECSQADAAAALGQAE